MPERYSPTHSASRGISAERPRVRPAGLPAGPKEWTEINHIVERQMQPRHASSRFCWKSLTKSRLPVSPTHAPPWNFLHVALGEPNYFYTKVGYPVVDAIGLLPPRRL